MTVLRFAIVAAWPLLIEATLLTMWSRATKELPELGLMMPACTMAFHLAALRFFPNRGRGWWFAGRVYPVMMTCWTPYMQKHELSLTLPRSHFGEFEIA